jgi:hypothetical protein
MGSVLKGISDNKMMETIDLLRKENARLRRLLADAIAQRVWLEGGNFAKIEREILTYGYKLKAGKGDPMIVPVEEK